MTSGQGGSLAPAAAAQLSAATGTLLVARGYEITSSFIERIGNFQPGMLSGDVRILAP